MRATANVCSNHSFVQRDVQSVLAHMCTVVYVPLYTYSVYDHSNEVSVHVLAKNQQHFKRLFHIK